MKNKNVYIIAGPNGSGKTTFANTFLPEYTQCNRFINADLIAQGLSPFSPQIVAIKAGKLVLEQIKEYTKNNVTFSFETTMAGTTHTKYFKMLKKNNYKINIFFLWIPSTQLAIARVKSRVLQGGHNIPIIDIKRRYNRSIKNFFTTYRLLANQWMLFNNSQSKAELIASKNNNHINILNTKLLQKIINKNGVSL